MYNASGRCCESVGLGEETVAEIVDRLQLEEIGGAGLQKASRYLERSIVCDESLPLSDWQ